MTGPIDAAIAKTDPPPQQELVQMTVALSSGRLVMLAAARSMTEAEILELTAWVASADGLRNLLRPPSPILVPDQQRIVHP